MDALAEGQMARPIDEPVDGPNFKMNKNLKLNYLTSVYFWPVILCRTFVFIGNVRK